MAHLLGAEVGPDEAGGGWPLSQTALGWGFYL